MYGLSVTKHTRDNYYNKITVKIVIPCKMTPCKQTLSLQCILHVKNKNIHTVYIFLKKKKIVINLITDSTTN